MKKLHIRRKGQKVCLCGHAPKKFLKVHDGMPACLKCISSVIEQNSQLLRQCADMKRLIRELTLEIWKSATKGPWRKHKARARNNGETWTCTYVCNEPRTKRGS